MLFIDSEGAEVQWECLSEVLYYPGDLIFVFQTKEITELITRWKRHDAITRFFGTDKWRKYKNEEERVKLYKEQVKNVETKWNKRKREVIDSVTVKSGEGYHYDIIFATLKTKEGNPWFKKLLPYLKERIAKQTGETLRTALDVLAGRSTQIDWFLPTTLNKFLSERP